MSLLNHPRPSGKLARWALTIQDMDLVIKYRSGKSNTNADALSRNPVTQSLIAECSCYGVTTDERTAHVNTSSPVEEPVEEPKTPSREPTRSVQATEPNGTSCDGAGICSESSCKEKEVVPDDTLECDCLRKASQEIRDLQREDVDLLPYFQYLEERTVPTNEQESRRLVLECEKMEVIDGVLHHEDAADPARWCIVVPKQLRQVLLAEAHSAIFSGHLSEQKVYTDFDASTGGEV